MISDIIYQCQYQTMPENLCPTPAQPTYHARDIYLICMSAAFFRCSAVNCKSVFRVIVSFRVI